MTGIDMAQFNAFEEAIDFSFWKELCEKHGELHHYRRGEYFAYTGEAVKRVGGKIPRDTIALEDSDVLVIPTSMIRERLMSDPTLHIRFLDALFEQAYGHVLNDYRSTPEQRYRQLLARYPRLFELVSL